MRLTKLTLSVAFTLCLVAPACDEDIGADRSLVERAETHASRALANYADCASELDAVCTGEEDELRESLVDLQAARGPDAVSFRAKVTADCEGGGSVECSGDNCTATDNVGCACLDAAGRTLQSVAACPKTVQGPKANE